MSTRSTTKPIVNVPIRWMIRRDMAEVLRIEESSFEFHWSEQDFLACLRQRNCIGMVAEVQGKVVGFMIYELHKTQLRILNFAVTPEYRRMGIGRQMIEKLVGKLSQQRRQEIVLDVRETNIAAQYFFRRQDFLAVQVLRNHYEDSNEDAYVMAFRLEDAVAEPAVNNRISQYYAS